MKTKNRAFTLIEMLVVIVIIAILAGMLFRLFTMVTRRGDRAECIEMLERIADALNEYRSEYGMYPPVGTNVVYEYENTNTQERAFIGTHNPRTGWMPAHTDVEYEDVPLFKFDNLIAHLWPRGREDTFHTEFTTSVGGEVETVVYAQWIDDTERDKKAKARWAHFLEGVDLSTEDDGGKDVSAYTGVYCDYVNRMDHLYDPWGRDIRYECFPPYLTYRLWSLGPDGENGTDDDIHRDKWDN